MGWTNYICLLPICFRTLIISQTIIGLRGGIGSGKSAISNKFEQLGINIIDADIVAREVVAVGTDGLNKISNHLGADILNADKTLNRAKLREIIFKDEYQKTWLNNLLHPLIREQIVYQLNQSTSQYVILVAPLLFENNLNKLCDRSLLIDVPVDTQIQRTTSRDNVSIEQVRNIIASQMSREDKLNIADDVLDNSLPLEHAFKKVDELHQYYIALKN